MLATILLKQPAVVDTGIFHLQLNRKIIVNISAAEAQKRVTRFVHWEISSQMHAESPSLTVGDEIFWRVPVHLTLPAFGDVGCVGHIEVNPVTGAMTTFPSIIQRITQKAEELALRFISPAAQSI